MIQVGGDGVNTYDGFFFEGNGALLIGDGTTSLGGFWITGYTTECNVFHVKGLRVQNTGTYALAGGHFANSSQPTTGSFAGQMLFEDCKLSSCMWVLVECGENVVFKRVRGLGLLNTTNDGILVTAQPNRATTICRNVLFEDCYFNSNTTDFPGTAVGDSQLEIQGNLNGATVTNHTRNVYLRRCIFRTNPGVGDGSGGHYVDDAVNSTGNGYFDSVTFEDCTFDGPTGHMTVGNTQEGFLIYDHCEWINSAAPLVATYFAGGISNRPIIIRRPVTGQVYPNQNVAITVGASPFTFTNTHVYLLMVVSSGGTGVSIGFKPRGGASIGTGLTAGAFALGPGDAVVVTYTTAPTMTFAPV